MPGCSGTVAVDLTRVELPVGWAVAGWLAAALVLSRALRAAPWGRFADSEQVHVWYGTLFALILLWSIQATVGEGFTFHLLGVAALTLVAGPALALVGSAIAVAILMLVRGGHWPTAALAWCTMAALPVAVTWATLRFAERRLPAHFFVYVFVVAFFGAALSLVAAGLAGALVLTLGGGRAAGVVFGDYVPYLAYLAFGEATLNGMAMTLLIVYRPHWVATFDDARYIDGR
jgi:uncharacterized membrane protein